MHQTLISQAEKGILVDIDLNDALNQEYIGERVELAKSTRHIH